MNKTAHRLMSLAAVLTILLGNYSSAQASSPNQPRPVMDTISLQSAAFYKLLSPGDAGGLSLETSGLVEKITMTADGWTLQAGGNVATTHYARLKYKIPELAGIVPTTFYMKAVVVLPADFYTQQKAGFRILNTDNYSTTLNGVHVGAANTDELRTGVYINSDHTLRVNAVHQNGLQKEFYKSPTPLPVGEHVIELCGDVSVAAPWYLKIDGQVWASGVERLSPDSVPVSERVVTRLVAGIDGAADQSDNPMSLTVKSFAIADYDVSVNPSFQPTPTPPVQLATFTSAPSATSTNPPASPTSTVTMIASSATPASIPATSTLAPATQTPTSSIPSPTVTSPVSTPTVLPATATLRPIIEKIYDDKDTGFVYSPGWVNISKSQAYKRSYKLTTKNGSFVTFGFTGRSLSILYESGTAFRTINVYVDGLLMGTINEKTSKSSFQRRWDFPGTLTSGNHTLKLVFVTTDTSNQTSGSLDAVIVR